MATPTTLAQIAFAGGFDESQRPEVLDPNTAFTNVENCVQDARGGFSKRLGFTSLTLSRLSGSRSSGVTAFVHKGVPAVVDSSNQLDVYSSATTAWVTRGEMAGVNLDIIDIPAMSTANGGEVVDIARAGGYLVQGHLGLVGSVNGFYASVTDVNGAVVRSLERLGLSTTNGSALALASYGDRYVIAIMVDEGHATITAKYIDLGSAASINTGWVSMTAPATDHIISGGPEGVALSSESMTNRIAFAYVNNSAGASQVTVKTMTVAGVTETATVNTSSNTPGSVAVEGSIADTLWVAWNEGTAVKIKGLDADNLGAALATTSASLITLASSSLPQINILSSTVAGSGNLIVNDGGWDRVHFAGFTTSGGTAIANGSATTAYAVQMTSRPYAYGSRWFCLFKPIEGVGSGQSVRVVCDWTTTTPALKPIANLEAGRSTSFVNAHWVTNGTSSVLMAPFSLTTSSVAASARLARITHTPGRLRSVSHANSTYVEGGILQCFDGQRPAEANFLYAPSKPSTSVGGTGITGSFRYVAVYEDMESSGNWVVSAVSEPSASQTAANQTITVTTIPYVLTSRMRNSTNDLRTRVVFYRTATGGEEPYYRLAEVPMDTTDGTMTYQDSTTDATLTEREQLYGTGSLPSTDGAGLDKMAPPGLRHIVGYNGMLVGALGPTLWFSSQLVPGEAPWFNPVFQVPLPDDVTALETQDGTLYAFTRSGVYGIAGEPPQDNGLGGLGTPRKFAVDIGATSSLTCACNLGIIYRSARGIELLTRGGQSVEHIGEGIQDTLATYPIVTSMVLDTKHGFVRIGLATGETSGLVAGTGVTVVFDLSLRVWLSKHIMNGATATPSQHACMVQVADEWRYGWLAADGTLYYERLSSDASAHVDGASTFVTMTVETAWFKLSGLQGRQHLNRVLMLSKRSTAHGLSMSLAYDYNTTYQSARAWTEAQITSLASALPNQQVCHQSHDESPTQAVRVKIVDTTPATLGSGKGATWIGLTLDVTPQQGAYELPDTAA